MVKKLFFVLIIMILTVNTSVAKNDRTNKTDSYKEMILRNRTEGLKSVLKEAKGSICDDVPFYERIDKADSLLGTIDYTDYYDGMTKVRIAWNWMLWASSYVGLLDEISDALKNSNGDKSNSPSDSIMSEYNKLRSVLDTVTAKNEDVALTALFEEIESFAEYSKLGMKNQKFKKAQVSMLDCMVNFCRDERCKSMDKEQFYGYIDAQEVTPLFGTCSYIIRAVLSGRYMSNRMFAVAMGAKRRKTSKKEWQKIGDIVTKVANECDKQVSPIRHYVYDTKNSEVMDSEEIYRRIAEASVWQKKMEEELTGVLKREREHWNGKK